jgi:2'-phosphotransferase
MLFLCTRRMGKRQDEPMGVQQSKALSYILRHGAVKEGLAIRSDGFIKVEDLVCRL